MWKLSDIGGFKIMIWVLYTTLSLKSNGKLLSDITIGVCHLRDSFNIYYIASMLLSYYQIENGLIKWNDHNYEDNQIDILQWRCKQKYNFFRSNTFVTSITSLPNLPGPPIPPGIPLLPLSPYKKEKEMGQDITWYVQTSTT